MNIQSDITCFKVLCLCFDHAHHVCLQAAIITLSPCSMYVRVGNFPQVPSAAIGAQLDPTVMVSHTFPFC